VNKAPNYQEIKVRVQIPDNVPFRQQKINRIYDILKPADTLENTRNPRYTNSSVLSAFDEKGGLA